MIDWIDWNGGIGIGPRILRNTSHITSLVARTRLQASVDTLIHVVQ